MLFEWVDGGWKKVLEHRKDADGIASTEEGLGDEKANSRSTSTRVPKQADEKKITENSPSSFSC